MPEKYAAHPREGRLFWVLDWDDGDDLREGDGGSMDYVMEKGEPPDVAYRRATVKLIKNIPLEWVCNKDWRLVISPMGYDVVNTKVYGGGVRIDEPEGS